MEEDDGMWVFFFSYCAQRCRKMQDNLGKLERTKKTLKKITKMSLDRLEMAASFMGVSIAPL
jgi:hypothetical protein